LTAPGKPLDDPLEVALNLTPKSLLQKIIENDSPTVQAAVETLMSDLAFLGRKDEFASLFKVIKHIHPKWACRSLYLEYAGGLGCVETCHLLLGMELRPNYDDKNWECDGNYADAVLESVARGHIECAKVLLRHAIKANATPFQQQGTPAMTIFGVFLETVVEGTYHSIQLGHGDKLPFGLENPAVLHILDWFLKAGANVDLPFQYRSCDLFSYARYAREYWTFTVLDYTYFENPELYSHLVGYSVNFGVKLTRSGIHRSANEGISSLYTYLVSRASHTPTDQDKILDIFFTEEFQKRKWRKNLGFNIIRTFLDYDLGLQGFRIKLSVSEMIYYVVDAACQQGIHPSLCPILTALIHKGAEITAETIDAAVENEGTALIQLLYSYGADIKNQGALALGTAAKLGNYNAVDWLLDKGIDINAARFVNDTGKQMSIMACANKSGAHGRVDILGHVVHPQIYRERPIMSCAMLKYLISRHAKPRANPNETSLRYFLGLVIRYGVKDGDLTETFNKVEYLLNAEPLIDDPSSTEPCLLESCFASQMHSSSRSLPHEILALLKLLLNHGVSVRGSGILSLLILSHAPLDEIERYLNSGVDINAYFGKYWDYQENIYQCTPIQAAAFVGSIDLARLLLQKGANINQPGVGNSRYTAFQFACIFSPWGERERLDKFNLIKFFIDNRADVNPPGGGGMSTPIETAAGEGNFEIVLLLLSNGADVNGPHMRWNNPSPLDEAARFGNLDMVQFLLNLGALSHKRGESGYRGAIHTSECEGYQAVADMIRQHAIKNGKCGEELVAHYRQWEDSASDDDSDNVSGASDAGSEGLEVLEE
jgi:ankyrin repeat protein